MADVQSLRSYLVALGFQVNNTQLTNFNNAMKQTGTTVQGLTTHWIGLFQKFAIVSVKAFVDLGSAAVQAADKIAMKDQEFRLWGQTMFMDVGHARNLKIAMDALGASLEQIAFDPELHERFIELQNVQKTLAGQLGGNFEDNMRKIRDVRFEFSKMRVEFEYFSMNFLNKMVQALGGDNFINWLKQLNDYIVQHIPEWSTYLTEQVVPVLKDIWQIAKDVWAIIVMLATAFDNFVAIISGDKTLTGTANMDKFARSVEHVVSLFATLLKFALHFFGLISGTLGGGTVGGILGTIIGGIAGIPGGPLGILGGAVTGGTTGALWGAGAGATTGAIFDLIRNTSPASTALPAIPGGVGNEGGTTSTGGMGGGTASTGGIGGIAGSNDIRALAAQVGGNLGINPAIIYAQWYHETGGFSNRGARTLHNLAGIRYPGSTEYHNFASFAEFGNYYTGLIRRRYPEALGAQSPEVFAGALKRHGYFEDTLSNYVRGMRGAMGQYGGVTIGSININQPNATAEQIASVVSERIQQQQQQQNAYNLAELRPAFG